MRDVVDEPRAQSAPPPSIPLPSADGSRAFAGRGVSPGRARGPVVAAADLSRSATFPADEPPVVVADTLTPAQVSALAGVAAAVCLVGGTPGSHASQIAVTRGLPMIVGVDAALLVAGPGEHAWVDGTSGTVLLARCRDALPEVQRRPAADHGARGEPHSLSVETADGVAIGVTGAVCHPDDVQGVLDAGMSGVGAIPTETLFFDLDRAPDVEDHYSVYRRILTAVGSRPVSIRTLDLGCDKDLPELHLAAEDNSFLGVRGTRLMLRRPDLFGPQLTGLYRAARDTDTRPLLIFPMISRIEEFRDAAALCEQTRQREDAPSLPLAVMLEVPSAALLAGEFLREADAMVIGTNDLTQYVLATSRTNVELAGDYDRLHPAVLRTIRLATDAAAAHAKPVVACGGAAGDPAGAALLVGLGVRDLVVSVSLFPGVRDILGRRTLAELESLAEAALSATTAGEVHDLVRARTGHVGPGHTADPPCG